MVLVVLGTLLALAGAFVATQNTRSQMAVPAFICGVTLVLIGLYA